MEKIKVFNCTQITEGQPFFKGICSECGKNIALMEVGAAKWVMDYSHNLGMKKGIIIGIGSALIGIATAWSIRKCMKDDNK